MDEQKIGWIVGLFVGLVMVGAVLGPFIWQIAFSDPFEAPPCPGHGEPNFVHGIILRNYGDSIEDIMNRLERAGWQNVTLHESGSYVTAYCPQEIEGGNNDG